MRKFLFFAAACVALVACNNKDNALNGEQPKAPKEKVTISATINLGDEAKAAIRMVQPNADDMASLTDGKTINFHWEEGDSVTLSNDGGSKVFKMVSGSISADGKSANFEGEPLDDMSSYEVQYRNFGFILMWDDWLLTGIDPLKVPIAVLGTGNDDGFILDDYASLLRLPLTGTDQISKIVWNHGSLNHHYIYASSIQLSSTASAVYLPCVSQNTTFSEDNKLSFYDASSNLIMEKSFTADTENWSFRNSILTFPELEVKAAPADYICFTALANSTVSFGQYWAMYAGFGDMKLQWKKNNGSWDNIAFSYSSPVPSMELNEGDKLYVRTYESNSELGQPGRNMFSISGNVKLSGNIMALLNINPGSASMFEDCFQYLFEGAITDASELILPSTNLTNGCYKYMFRKCSSLVKTPELPATQLANECYKNMFRDCTSLVNAPVLPATTLTEECYHSMFSGCTSLVNAPELPVTTLANNCYGYMFNGCSNLVKAPELPATTLATYCYSHMFENCSNLETAPVLKAATLVQNCYTSMFCNCSKLSSVTMLATSVGKNEDVCLVAWLDNTASSGTIYAANAAAITAINNLDYSKYSGGGPKPAGWTITVKP